MTLKNSSQLNFWKLFFSIRKLYYVTFKNNFYNLKLYGLGVITVITVLPYATL